MMNSAYSLEAENSVLGSILLDASVFPGVREALTAEDFSNTVNQAIYRAAEGLFNAGKVVDPVSIKRAAEAILGGSEDVNLNDYMLQLLEITPPAHRDCPEDRDVCRKLLSTQRGDSFRSESLTRH